MSKEANYLSGYAKEKCAHCGLKRTPEGHDGCIGTLENVMNACCGHGEVRMAYVQFNHSNYKENTNKLRLEGNEALEYINNNKKAVMKICQRCEKDAIEIYPCEICDQLICEKCQAVYNQFTQIDYNCCKGCANQN